jgi:hypothetical protein
MKSVFAGAVQKIVPVESLLKSEIVMDGFKFGIVTGTHEVSIHPVFVEIIRHERYVPGALYICVGFDTVDVEPSPKSHIQLIILSGPPVETSLKNIILGFRESEKVKYWEPHCALVCKLNPVNRKVKSAST